MPVYEYRCEDCGARLSARQRMSDPPLEVCGDRCAADEPALRGRGRLVRVPSAPFVGRSARAPASTAPAPGACATCPGAPTCDAARS